MDKPKILVPYDDSLAAERALDWAGAAARATGGTVTILKIINSMPSAGAVLAAVPYLPDPEELRRLEQALAGVADQHRVAATVRVILSPLLGDTIVHEAERQGIDLIVMGTHGRGGLTRLALGSVAEHVVRNASCPVVTMRAQAKAD